MQKQSFQIPPVWKALSVEGGLTVETQRIFKDLIGLFENP